MNSPYLSIRQSWIAGLSGLFLLLSMILLPGNLHAQSTQGTILGTVKDPTGAAVPDAKVTITNMDSQTTRTTVTNGAGDYHVFNLEPARYDLTVEYNGFKSGDVKNLQLDARQELRTDVTLVVGSSVQEVVVDAAAEAVIPTETPSISSTLSAKSIEDLPANYRSISTSPLNVIQTLPGVQADSAIFPPAPAADASSPANFSIQGGLPSQSETTVDGISAQNVTDNAPLSDAFPSANSIAEIRVDGSMNDAQFGQPGEITTITKSGTNTLHGSVFWYFQNSGFDAIPYGAATKPKKVANNFGGNLGGPVILPHLYNGRSKTFFFGDYEGFRFPQGQPKQYVVPTMLERSGDFSQELAPNTLKNPFVPGTTYADDRVPSISSSSAAFLNLFPLPNIGNTTSEATALSTLGYNYAINKPSNYGSNQYDIRLDHYFGQKGLLFGRYTSKDINLQNPNVLNIPNSTAFDRYRILVTSFSYNISSSMVNELRFGFTLEANGTSNPLDGAAITDSAQLNGIGPNFPFNGITELDFSKLTKLNADRLNQSTNSRLYQYADDLTWSKGAHTVKFGADIRQVEAITPLGFIGANNYGTFTFNGSFTGHEFADYLLGIPQTSSLVNVTQDNDGASSAFAFYAQDTWKATPRLTMSYGVRYELHPAYHADSGNIGNFDPSVPRTGRLVYPDGKEALLSPGVLSNVNACPVNGVNNPYATGNPSANGIPCTPVVNNSAAGLPSSLRNYPKLRFMPRIGLAYRPFNDNKTAIRAGAGFYNITTLGSSFFSLTGTLQSDVRTFPNTETSTGPQYAFPSTSNGDTGLSTPSLGTASFGTANEIGWHDPYSIQWNLSIDRDLGKQWSARASYIAMRTLHLVWAPDLNDMSYSTTIATTRPLTDRPFPDWGAINDRLTGASATYNSMQLELSRHFRSGLSMNAAYTLAKNLSDNQVPNKPGFAGENGGGKSTYFYDRHIDYGDVYGTRRHRLIMTSVYHLPMGRGQMFGSGMSRWADALVGGWQLSGIFLWQTGPYLTPFIASGSADPSGTGSGSIFGRAQYPDRVPGAPLYPANRSRSSWINPQAFACPSNTGYTATSFAGHSCTVGIGSAPIGRFGNSRASVVEGPGTTNLSLGLRKTFQITENYHLRAEGTFTNVLNHTNLADPNVNITSGSFGIITAARGSDFGGNRTGQVSLALEF